MEPKKERTKGSYWIFWTFYLIFLLLIGLLLFWPRSVKQDIWEFQNLAKEVHEAKAASSESISDSTAILPQYEALYRRNGDLCGWIQLEGTTIDYPVMATPQEPDYYWDRSFGRQESRSGVPYIWSGKGMSDANIVVYGHNLSTGTMFTPLLGYMQETFWREHPLIRLDSLFAEGSFEVIAAFFCRAGETEERYPWNLNLSNGDVKSQNAYIQAIQQAAIYDTGITPDPTAQQLTLLTYSDYENQDQFFVVVAQKSDKETKE